MAIESDKTEPPTPTMDDLVNAAQRLVDALRLEAQEIGHGHRPRALYVIYARVELQRVIDLIRAAALEPPAAPSAVAEQTPRLYGPESRL